MSAALDFATELRLIDNALGITDPPSPRLGANVIVVDGRNVDVWVEEHSGEYRASEMDYDLGRPVSMRSSIAAALHDLQKLLMDEITECTACTDGECDTHD